MIQVTIFEDHTDMRAILSTLVETSDDLLLVVWYWSRPNRKTHFPQVQVLVQSMFDDNERVFAALCMGASGYILKSTTADKVLEAIADTYNGGSPMTPHIARSS